MAEGAIGRGGDGEMGRWRDGAMEEGAMERFIFNQNRYLTDPFSGL